MRSYLATLILFSLYCVFLQDNSLEQELDLHGVNVHKERDVSNPESRLVKKDMKQASHSRKVPASVLSNLFENVMLTYDRKFRPGYDSDEPITVKLELHVLSFSNFDEGAMDYGMDFYFAQFWNDPRFKVADAHLNTLINLVGKDADSLWLPDTVFVNSKSSKFHDVTVNNRFLSINFSDGEIVYHARISTKASCRMDLRDYPFDQQTCYLAIESYGHDATDLVYKWYDNDLLNCTSDHCRKLVVYDKEMSNFDVVEAIKSKEKTTYHAQSFSSATARFTFKRRTQYFILQVYLPCMLLVMVTWTSFWITPKAVPARSAICVTTILTLMTMLGIVNVNMPKVSYIKALDLYLLVSFIFVFLSLLEFILVLNCSNFLTANERNNRDKDKFTTKKSSSYLHNGKNKESNMNGYSHRHNHHVTSTRARKNFCDRKISNATIIDMELDDKYEKCERKSIFVFHGSSSTTDMVARFLFPIAYTCFNIGYWTSYLTQKSAYEE